MKYVHELNSMAVMKALLSYLREENGWCLEAGAGKKDFYCGLFAEMGESTMVIEPIVTPQLREVLERYPSIELIEGCLGDRIGKQIVFRGRHDNDDLASTSGD